MAFLYASNSDDPKAGLVEVTGHVVSQTAKALRFTDGAAAQWLPKSKCKIENNADGTVSICMPKWLAKEKGYYG